MTATRPKNLKRALVGILSLGVVLTPVLVPGTADAKPSDPKFRKVSAPNVFYPVTGTKRVKDLRTSTDKHYGTDIKAPCGVQVYAAHPGTAHISKGALGNTIRVTSNTGGLITTYAYLSAVSVVEGQPIQSGQVVGKVGTKPKATCELYFSVNRGGKRVNATTWLKRFVGQAPPVANLYGNRGFLVASYNVLGASHTRGSSRYATGNARITKSMSLLNSRAIDVVGTQEFQESQFDYWTAQGHANTWGSYYWDPAGKGRDTENAVIWRKSTMEFVKGETFDIPYFNGNIRHVPAVLLRHKASGRTVWVLSVHNAANVNGPAAKWRARAIAIEKQKIIDLRATGRPVILTGDFNDRQAAFCPLTANKLSISPNSIPSMACAFPKQTSIDWIFAAGQVRFSSFLRDTYTQRTRMSDHPLVQARAHLQN